MLSEREVSAAIGTTAYGANGDKLGTVEHFYVDDRTGAPSWVAVSTGLFGTRHSIAPAGDAAFGDGRLSLPVTADALKSAPSLSGDHLDPADEAELRRHYGFGDHTAGTRPAEPATQELRMPPPPVPTETPTPVPAPVTDGSMVRSEEQLRVGTERVATTRARLVKYVVTEEVQITVPIRREEIRVEEVPLDATDVGTGESLLDDDGQTTGAGTGGLPEEIVLHTERPVVTVEVVPTERVRLRTELVEGQETITGQVQREQIAVDESPSRDVSPR